MPSNYFIFSTGGDWDSTTLYNNGDEYMADRLYIDLKAGRDDFGNFVRGGLVDGNADATAMVVPQGTSQEVGIFPGKIDLEFPMHKVTVHNDTPQFAIEFTRVILDGADVTEQVVDFVTDIDAVNNNVQAYIMLYKPHFLAADEVATINLI
ncbi:MAG TPA: hypothetical protein VKT78_04390 [Fimbriimonadaceae bacterium]|nr:hypothetical protein [Fimbriimonadaceae bacterium]